MEVISIDIHIKEFRQACGMTQAQLAQRLGLKSQSTVAMWERDRRKVPSDILPELADLFGCSIDALFGRSPPDGKSA